jgi:tRNA-2-methylthio-N6-dimethylallyladenosine synthase
MNKAESDSFVLQLHGSGWEAAASPHDCDLVILNTCSVRITAEERIWGRLGFYRHEKQHRRFVLLVTGCMAQRLKDELLHEAPEIDIIIGNFNKHRIIENIEHVIDRNEKRAFTSEGDYVFSSIHSSTSFKSFVPIMHGCDNFCSYCIVPYVRGRELSRDPKTILIEIESLVKNGVKEVTVLGQNVNSYRYDDSGNTIRFSDLMDSISQTADDSAWIRFLTSHPKDFPEELIDIIAARKNICKHIHLPMQHASNRILGLMNRRYSWEFYRDLIRSIRRSIPDISITTDILIGFPGESDEDFNLVLDAMEEIGFDDAFTYKYNPREGTKAYAMGDTIPEDTKLERLDAVIRLERKISSEKKKEKLGRIVRALVEEISKKHPDELLARSENDEMIVFPGQKVKIGTFVEIEITGVSGNTLRGKEMIPCHGN